MWYLIANDLSLINVNITQFNWIFFMRIILFRIRFFLRQDIFPSVRWYTLTPLFNTQYVILRKFHFQINGSINPALFYYLYYPFSAVKTYGVSFNSVNFSRLLLNVSNRSFWLPILFFLLNTVTHSASGGQETKLDKKMVDCEPYFIRYYNQYLIFVLLKNLNTMSYLKKWSQSCKEETNTFINDLCLLSFKIFDYYH